MFAHEIREQLQQQRICDPSCVPSVSSINRILRNSGLWTDEMTSSQQNAAAAAAYQMTSASYLTQAHIYATANAMPSSAAAAGATGSNEGTSSISSHHTHPLTHHSNTHMSQHPPHGHHHAMSLPPQFRYTSASTQAAESSKNVEGRLHLEIPIKPSPKHPIAHPGSGNATGNNSTLTLLSASVSNTTLATPGQLNAQDLSYSLATSTSTSLPKHWLWNPSLLYSAQHVQAAAVAAGQHFFPYAHPQFPGYFHATVGMTKSESSIDLTTPSASEPLSDCDSGKSSPTGVSAQTKVNISRKRNPYSIEELLKKPEKRLKQSTSVSSITSLKTLKSKAVVGQEEEISIECSSSSSGGGSSGASSSSSSCGDSCDEVRSQNEETIKVEECGENLEVVN